MCVCVQAMEIEVPNIPHIPERGTHKVYFDPSNLYIDASDFKEVLYTNYDMLHIHVHVHACTSCAFTYYSCIVSYMYSMCIHV